MRMKFVLDVDGVMTTGHFLYSESGKEYKIFGPHDADGLKLLKDKLDIFFITADKKGLPISEKRIVADMGYPLHVVSEKERFDYIKNNFGFEDLIYMGDGIFDAEILRACKYGIAPRNARVEAKKAANFVTNSRSGEGAVCDACLEVQQKFFTSENNHKYKFCILAAGVGSRMEGFTKHFNKALIPIQGKPVISHIIEKVPEEIEIIIATGHMRESLISFIKSGYPNRKITFVEVDKYIGEGTGPGYSLLQCREHLQCPFIYESVDTLFNELIVEPMENWMGIAPVKETERYCTVKIKNNLIYQLDDKIKTDNKFAFIGIAGVKDYEIFWDALQKDKSIIGGEIQASNGFKSLIEKELHPKIFTWFDTGTTESYQYALNNYPFGKSYGGTDERL